MIKYKQETIKEIYIPCLLRTIVRVLFMKKVSQKNIKEDDSVSALAQYLENNRGQAYSFATANTKYNKQGHPVITKDDEWAEESEWDDLFELLSLSLIHI